MINRLRVRLFALWQVLVSDYFFVCTATSHKDRVAIFDGHCCKIGETTEWAIFESLIQRMAEAKVIIRKHENDKPQNQ